MDKVKSLGVKKIGIAVILILVLIFIVNIFTGSNDIEKFMKEKIKEEYSSSQGYKLSGLKVKTVATNKKENWYALDVKYTVKSSGVTAKEQSIVTVQYEKDYGGFTGNYYPYGKDEIYSRSSAIKAAKEYIK